MVPRVQRTLARRPSQACHCWGCGGTWPWSCTTCSNVCSETLTSAWQPGVMILSKELSSADYTRGASPNGQQAGKARETQMFSRPQLKVATKTWHMCAVQRRPQTLRLFLRTDNYHPHDPGYYPFGAKSSFGSMSCMLCASQPSSMLEMHQRADQRPYHQRSVAAAPNRRTRCSQSWMPPFRWKFRVVQASRLQFAIQMSEKQQHAIGALAKLLRRTCETFASHSNLMQLLNPTC